MEKISINERPRSRSDLASWYGAALEEQAASGLSVAEYAAQLGVTPATLYQWRRRLCARDHEERRSPASFGLVEVMLEGDSCGSSTRPFVVRLGQGRSVEVPREFGDAELRRLITVLESC